MILVIRICVSLYSMNGWSVHYIPSVKHSFKSKGHRAKEHKQLLAKRYRNKGICTITAPAFLTGAAFSHLLYNCWSTNVLIKKYWIPVQAFKRGIADWESTGLTASTFTVAVGIVGLWWRMHNSSILNLVWNCRLFCKLMIAELQNCSNILVLHYGKGLS